jgi:isochorismate hydrolase
MEVIRKNDYGNAGMYYKKLPRCKDLITLSNTKTRYNINHKITKSLDISEEERKEMIEVLLDNYKNIKDFCKQTGTPLNKTYQVLNGTQNGHIITRNFINNIKRNLGMLNEKI